MDRAWVRRSCWFTVSSGFLLASALCRGADDFPPPDSEAETISDEVRVSDRAPGKKRGGDKDRDHNETTTSDRSPEDAHAEPSSDVADVDAAPIPVDAKPARRESERAIPRVKIKPTQFNGAEAGKTTRAELEKAWGQPKKESNSELHYEIEPFENVVVTLKDGVVDGVVLTLAQAIAADRLAGELGLADSLPVEVCDSHGEPLGETYPERGVVLSFHGDPARREVSQILLAPIDAQAFLLRAEMYRHYRYESSLADLDYVFELDPDNARAHLVRSQLLTDLGRYPLALRDAEAAVKADENNAEYRVALATALGKVGQAEAAQEQAEKAVQLAAESSVVKAGALHCLAETLLIPATPDFKRATELNQEAIKIAESVSADQQAGDWDQALVVSLKAHLALARGIAWGDWKSKSTVAPKWLDRAQVIAEQIAKQDVGVGDESFLVAKEALATYVGLQGKLDPGDWTTSAMQSGRELIAQSKDTLAKSRWEWELGAALYDSAQVYHMRRMYQPALENAELAAKCLERAGSERASIPGQAYMMGRLYFRIGSIHAIQYRDHQQAVVWFEKAIPFLEEPIPDSALADVGRQGETFVSIGVSYWDVKRQDEAVRLTKEGLRLMDQGVKEGVLERSALLIPYGNLARMHRQLGDKEQALHYTELAKRVENVTQR